MIQWDILTTKEMETDIMIKYIRSLIKYSMYINWKILMFDISTLHKLKFPLKESDFPLLFFLLCTSTYTCSASAVKWLLSFELS